MDPLVVSMVGVFLILFPVFLLRGANLTKPESAWHYWWFNFTIWSMWAGAMVCALILFATALGF